jgi:hypothetical protein
MSEGFLTSDTFDTTWIKPIGQEWKQVTYYAVDGLAVFEGCIIIGTVEEAKAVKAQIEANPELLTPGTQPFGSAIVGVQYRWKNNLLPYEIDPALPNQDRVTDAIKHWEQNTPFRFVKRDPKNAAHYDYVRFGPGSGCASSVGRRGGAQDVILGDECTTGNCIHEIGHTIGLWHEQSRKDRDKFITINWPSIMPQTTHNFDQHIADGDDLGAYDYGSIMHYPKDAFSVDGKDTIVPTTAGVEIGQRKALSPGDIASAKKLVSP